MKTRKSFALAALSLLAATAFTACSADEDIQNSLAPAADSDAIIFRVENAASARNSTRDMETSVTGFKVSALDRGAAYFSSPMNAFPSDGGSAWTTSAKTYWPADRSLTFVAYVDESPRSGSFRLDGGMASFENYEVPSDVIDQTDLMYAVAKDVTKASSKNGVGLRFRHALSQVTFTAQNNHPAYSSIEILSVELGGVKGKGTYSFPQTSTGNGASGSWTIDADASDRSYTISNIGVTLPACGNDCRGEKVNLCSETRGGDNVMYLMPQTLDEGAYIKVTARMSLKDAPGQSYVSEEVIPVSGEWQEGQRYSYSIVWNATPINFNVNVADFKGVEILADL